MYHQNLLRLQPTDRKKHTFSNTSGPSPPTNTRPMQCTNSPAHHHKTYINRHNDDYHHKSNCVINPTNHRIKSLRHINKSHDTISNTDVRTNNSDTTAPRGRRDGQAPRRRSRGRGFHFNLNAQMALTQHLHFMTRPIAGGYRRHLPHHWQCP